MFGFETFFAVCLFFVIGYFISEEVRTRIKEEPLLMLLFLISVLVVGGTLLFGAWFFLSGGEVF